MSISTSYDERNRPYEPVGSARELLYSRDPEVCLVGPAGTGKTRANLEKLNLVCSKYEGAKCLILRKTRASCTDSVLPTFEEKVLPEGSPVKDGAMRRNRHSYVYPNRSEIVAGGMDKPTRILSTEWDIIYVAEAIELEEDEWETLTGRLRNWKLPYQQIIADTNPGPPTHWLKRRLDEGQTKLIRSVHEDNPALYDRRLETWTTVGEKYLDTLKAMQGHRRRRFFEGVWAAAEGARWPDLDHRIHQFRMADRFPKGMPEEWVSVLGLDYGKAAAYAAVWVAIDFEGNKWVYRVDYVAGLHARDQAKRVVQRTKSTERIKVIRADPACWSTPATIDPWEQPPSAADFYAEVFKADKRFGPLERGYNRSRMHALETIDDGLDHNNGSGNLYIEESCVELWNELTGAIWDRNGKEDIDAGCPDHAITALYYAIHTAHDDRPRQIVKAITVDDVNRSMALTAKRASDQHFRRLAKAMRNQ